MQGELIYGQPAANEPIAVAYRQLTGYTTHSSSSDYCATTWYTIFVATESTEYRSISSGYHATKQMAHQVRKLVINAENIECCSSSSHTPCDKRPGDQPDQVHAAAQCVSH